ncbi:MAG: hypothetical protein HY060_07490 [Proteobacteria bacterium]|nr:hypothetical protein [Pseudomonadota bacterium]
MAHLVRTLEVVAILASLHLSSPGGVEAQPADDQPEEAPLIDEVTTEATVGPYRVTIDRPSEGGELHVFRDGTLVFARSGRDSIVHFFFDRRASPGTDITGEGIPDLVIHTTTTDYRYCCDALLLLELGPQVRVIQDINGRYGNVWLEREPENDRWLIKLTPLVEFMWHSSHSGSPQCELTLAYRAGSFRLVTTELRQPPYSRAALRELAAGIRESGTWLSPDERALGWYPQDLMSDMVDLAYTGNLRQAYQLLRLSWPRGAAERERMEREFDGILRDQPEWPEVRALNHLPPLPGAAPADRPRICDPT